MISALKPMIAPGSSLCTKCNQSSFNNIRRTSEVCKCSYIHHFQIDHNACCLPTKILYKHCLRFLFGRRQYSGNTLPLQQKYRALSFPLFSALKNVHSKYDALHESLILFDCQLLLHSRTCHQQKIGIVKS